uniref:Kazal-like domain-containing protein n=1 Tax=Romanomermis culicivorax TaxID=13658 RepID=A0A915HGS1_ROMCU
MIVSGLLNVSMATFEKRFYLTKFDSGFLITAYELAVALVLLPIAHYGEKGRKSTWIGFGMLLMGSGSLICASAQFAIDQYEFDDLKSYVCDTTDGGSVEKQECTPKKGGEQVASKLILVGQFLHGFGAAPLYTLGVTFLDESVLQYDSPLYLGIFYGVSLLGSAFGYIIGGASLNVYGDLDKFLFVNWTWLSLLLMKVADWFYISGFHSFFGTILENFFSFPPAWSHMVAGGILVPGGLVGNIVGGVIVSKTKMGVRKMFLSLIILEIFAFFSIFGLYAYCSNTKFAGVTYHSPFASSNDTLNIIDSCNRPCKCGSEYNPICYKEAKMVYFSPCYAGCQGMTEDSTTKKKTWHNCSCLAEDLTENSADEGFCHESCALSIVFILSAFAQILFTFSAHIPALMAELRCVHFDDRTLAVSVSWTFVRVFGTIPGSFLYRWLVDKSCILWNKTCDGSLKCLRYDNTTMARLITGTGAFWKFLVILFVVMGYVKYKPIKDFTLASDKAPTQQGRKSILVSKSIIASPGSKISTNSKKNTATKESAATNK